MTGPEMVLALRAGTGFFEPGAALMSVSVGFGVVEPLGAEGDGGGGGVRDSLLLSVLSPGRLWPAGKEATATAESSVTTLSVTPPAIWRRRRTTAMRSCTAGLRSRCGG